MTKKIVKSKKTTPKPTLTHLKVEDLKVDMQFVDSAENTYTLLSINHSYRKSGDVYISLEENRGGHKLRPCPLTAIDGLLFPCNKIGERL